MRRFLTIFLSGLFYFATTSFLAAQPLGEAKKPIFDQNEIIEVQYENLEQGQKYWALIMDPAIHKGFDRDYFQFVSLFGSRDKVARFRGLKDGQYLVRLHRAVKGSPILSEVEIQVNSAAAPKPTAAALKQVYNKEEPISVAFENLNPRQNYVALIMDPKRHKGSNGDYFEYIRISNFEQKTVKFKGLKQGKYWVRLHKAERGSKPLAQIDIEVKEVKEEQVASPCDKTIQREDVANCLVEHSMRYFKGRDLGSTQSQEILKYFSAGLKSAVYNRSALVSPCADLRKLPNLIGTFPPAVSSRYPEDIYSCEEASRIYEDIFLTGSNEKPQACNKAAPEHISSCFQALRKAQSATGNSAKRRKVIGQFSDELVKAVVRMDVKQAINSAGAGSRVDFDYALKQDYQSCQRNRRFEQDGFLATFNTYSAQGKFTLWDENQWRRKYCPGIIVAMFDAGKISERDRDVGLNIYERREQQVAANKIARENEIKRQNERNKQIAQRERALREKREAYLNSFEGKISIDAVKRYNQTALKALCIEQAILGQVANSGKTIANGGAFDVIYQNEACTLRLVIGSTATFNAWIAEVTDCANGRCNIVLTMDCNYRGAIMAESCVPLRNLKIPGTVSYDASGKFKELFLR